MGERSAEVLEDALSNNGNTDLTDETDFHRFLFLEIIEKISENQFHLLNQYSRCRSNH